MHRQVKSDKFSE